MAQFELAEAKTGRFEGFYANNRNDSGGETYAGIARNFHPNWKGWAIIDRIKPGRTAAQINIAAAKISEMQGLISSFYRSQFWDALRLSEFKHQGLANSVYDFAVNAGTGTAARYLQEAINIAYNDMILSQDGIVGPGTLREVNNYPRPRKVLFILAAIKAWHRIDRIRKKPSQAEFAESWLNRDFSYL